MFSSIAGLNMLNMSKYFYLADFENFAIFNTDYIDGLWQDCRNSIANVLELLQTCAKPPI